jgi:hypothetical protein
LGTFREQYIVSTEDARTDVQNYIGNFVGYFGENPLEPVPNERLWEKNGTKQMTPRRDEN